MPSTLTSLALTMAAEKAVFETGTRLVPLTAFSTGFKTAEEKKGKAVNVPVWSQGEAKDFDKKTANYAGTEKNVEGVDITLNKHLVDSHPYDDIDFEECDVDFWEGAGITAGRTVSKGILKKTYGLITPTNFAAKKVLSLADAEVLRNWSLLVAAADAADIDAAECTLLLNSTYFAYLAALLDVSKFGNPDAIQRGIVSSLFGFEKIIRCPTLPTDNGLIGAIAHPTCIGVAGRRLRPRSQKAYDETGYMTDETSGLTLGWRRFGDPKTGESFYAAEALFGADVISKKALVRLVSE